MTPTTIIPEPRHAMPPDFDRLPEAEVLSAPAAPVSLEQAKMLLEQHYGLAGELKPLTGERDANFLLRYTDTLGEDRRCLLKISHPVEAAPIADFQTQALLYLARHAPHLPVQRLLPTTQGRHAVETAALGDAPRVVRLLSFLDGLPMPQVARTARQQTSVARQLAALDAALAGLPRHVAANARLPWDIQRADSVRSLTTLIGESHRKHLVEHALQRFELHVQPRLPQLRAQAIHNDFNIFNLLVDPRHTDTVCGILDFGDMVWGPLIDDVAVAASYQVETEGDAQAGIIAFARAYHAVNPLRPEELDLLLDLIRARLAMVVCISGWRAARQPDNAEYVLRNNAISWARLSACHALDGHALRQALAIACP